MAEKNYENEYLKPINDIGIMIRHLLNIHLKGEVTDKLLLRLLADIPNAVRQHTIAMAKLVAETESTDLAALRDQNEELKKALEHYADELSWTHHPDDLPSKVCIIYMAPGDGRDVAIAALATNSSPRGKED